MNVIVYDTPGEQARLSVRKGPSWLGPALRGTIMLDVPVVAPDMYTEHWAQTALPAEVHWKRIQLLPIRGSVAHMSIRASNLLHTCTVTSDPEITLSLNALSPIDEFRDPVLPAKVGDRYSVHVFVGRITATADQNGSWLLARCVPGGIDLCTSMESLCEDVHRWSLEMKNPSPLATIVRSIWRFEEPVSQGATMAWGAVRAEPDTWTTRWDAVRGELTLRRSARAECAADAADIMQSLRFLSGVRVMGDGMPFRLVACDTGDAVIRCDQSDEIVTIVALPTASDDSPSLEELGGKCVQFVHDGEASIFIDAYVPRDDTLRVNATAIHILPDEARPAAGSDADWNGIPIVYMRRGDSLRADVSCVLGVGAMHSKFASACGGVSSVFEDGTLTLDIETVGQRTSRDVLAAACDAFSNAVRLFSTSIDHAFMAPRPALHFPARSIRALPRPPPTQPGPPMFQCVMCGSGPTPLPTCGKCGRSVMAKMRRRDAVLILV